MINAVKIWTIVWTLLFASGLRMPEANAHTDVGVFIEIPFNKNWIQPAQPASGCVATSLYYFLKFSPNGFLHSAISQIPGETAQDKIESLNRIAREIQGEQVFMGLSILEKEHFVQEVLSMAAIEGVTLELFPLQRSASEVKEGLFLKRVNQVLADSVEAKIPLISGFRFSLNEGGSLGHTVLITGVRKLPSLHKSNSDFEIEFLNPLHGRVEKLYVYEELQESFEAFIYNLENSEAVWSKDHLFVLNGKEMISSPYLKLKDSEQNTVQSVFELSDEVQGQAHLEEAMLLRFTQP